MERSVDGRSETVHELVPQLLKGLKYDDIVIRENERAEMSYNSGLKELAVVIAMAIDGGDCLLCKKPWGRFDVDNIFAKFFYYQPACNCYQVCTPGPPWYGCGRRMYEEFHGDRVKLRMRKNGKQEEVRAGFVCTHCGSWIPTGDWKPKI